MSTNKNLTLPLSQYIDVILEKYFSQIDNCVPTNLYQVILKEVEIPLFNAVMKHTKGNLSKTAEVLGINRGTLRKKLKEYNN